MRSDRLANSSFSMMRALCPSTVRTLMPSWSATCRFTFPSARRRNTSNSRVERSFFKAKPNPRNTDVERRFERDPDRSFRGYLSNCNLFLRSPIRSVIHYRKGNLISLQPFLKGQQCKSLANHKLIATSAPEKQRFGCLRKWNRRRWGRRRRGVPKARGWA
jgi:hypothetical protein